MMIKSIQEIRSLNSDIQRQVIGYYSKIIYLNKICKLNKKNIIAGTFSRIFYDLSNMKKDIKKVKINSEKICKEAENNSNCLFSTKVKYFQENPEKFSIFDFMKQEFADKISFKRKNKWFQKFVERVKQIEKNLRSGIEGKFKISMASFFIHLLRDRLNSSQFFPKIRYFLKFYRIIEIHERNNEKTSNFYCSLKFEKYRKYSPFLFHLEYKENLDSILHLMNLGSNEKFTITTYKRNKNYAIDCEQHKEFIFICGGYLDSNLNTCFILNLTSLPNVESFFCNLKESLANLSLVSTPFDLFMIGGHTGSDITSNCEKYSHLTKEWNYTLKLNNAQCCSTSSFIYPSEIYVFGSRDCSVFEKLGLNHKGETVGGWKILNLKNSFNRSFGISFQLNFNEILIFGGYYINDESFYSFDCSKSLLEKKPQKFVKNWFYCSKPRLFKGKIYIIRPESSYLFKIDFRNLTFEKSNLEF